MQRAALEELGFGTREDALGFLKRLWNEMETPCPICGSELELLHKGAKKDNCDWQCRECSKTFRTMHLLDEINERFA
ncbi:MAG: hypothetical protein J6M17_03880 [Ruminococcus sp.]|nr:hypothetical protein [Ruminococcus sp.]